MRVLLIVSLLSMLGFAASAEKLSCPDTHYLCGGVVCCPKN